MSGAARFVKKVFKKKFKFQKKWWKVAAIAVIAYFTFGLAAGAMPAGGAAAGTTAAGAGAAATGTGVMTTTAVAAGGTSAAAVTGAATVAGIETVTVVGAAGGISGAGLAGAAAAGGAAAASGMAGSSTGAAPSSQPVKPAEPVKPQTSFVDKAKGAWKDMSFSDKLLLAKAGVDVVAAATAPSPEEEAAAAAKWQGAFYGRTASEADQFMKTQNQATQIGQPTGQQREIVPSAEPVLPNKPQAAAAPMVQTPQRMQFQATAEKPEAQEPAPEAEQVTNMGGNRDLFAQRAKGVRYLV